MSQLRVNADALRKLTAALFRAHGVAAANADTVSDSLVCADLEGVASHGVTMVPLYLQRINQGSVDPHAEPVVVEDHGGLLVMSAQNALGQISARAAVALATARAATRGMPHIECAIVSGRNRGATVRAAESRQPRVDAA